MRTLAAIFLLSTLSFAAEDSPSGTRITPPTLREVSPRGIPRGATTEVSIVGYNLARASAIYFSEPTVTATITRIKELPDQDDVRLGGNGTPLTVDLGPLPVRNEITADVEIPADAPVGPMNFRVLTPLGLSPQGTLSLEPFYGESADKEPNDTTEQVTDFTGLPTILVGTISKPGDVDFYKIHVRAGQQLVFENNARFLGSALQPTITLYDENQTAIREWREDGSRRNSSFAQTFEKEGTYYIRISDYQESGSANHFYRIMVGPLPVVLTAFPLGVQAGKSAEIRLNGFNLATDKVTVKGEPNEGQLDSRLLRPAGKSGAAFTRVPLAIGEEPEIADGAATVSIPVTINGKLTEPHRDFRFHARKGQELLFEVNAARMGSPIDSQLEILDAAGHPVERATVRAIAQNSLQLRDASSNEATIRLDQQAGYRVGDYIMIGTEIVRVAAMPRGPDDDFGMSSFNGQRIAYLDTTSEAHAVDTPAYKVEIYPAGAKFPPNGLPLIHLMYRNDDGGPGYGKDSRLRFTAPADGEFMVRISDVRNLTGADFAYRLTIRPPHPDYRLSVSPRNPNVPVGGRIPITVTAFRMDDFDGPIPVSVKDLPPGLHAASGVILPGANSTTLTLSADMNAKPMGAVPLRVVDEKGREANAEDRLKLIAVIPRADIDVSAETREVILEPGAKATISVAVSRNNGFAGRVPLAIRNLPPTVLVTDVGLNGVLVNETETKRTFTLQALPNAEPVDQMIYVSGDIETRAGSQQDSILSDPIHLKVKATQVSMTQ
jgi:hypothetical protein